MKYQLLLATILSATAVAAQPTGDWSRMMYGGGSFMGILGTLFFVGLVVLVWLWVFKLWKEIKQMK